jgi:hypothetical protein
METTIIETIRFIQGNFVRQIYVGQEDVLLMKIREDNKGLIFGEDIQLYKLEPREREPEVWDHAYLWDSGHWEPMH